MTPVHPKLAFINTRLRSPGVVPVGISQEGNWAFAVLRRLLVSPDQFSMGARTVFGIGECATIHFLMYYVSEMLQAGFEAVRCLPQGEPNKTQWLREIRDLKSFYSAVS
jgi:hypothetical protein